MKAARWHAAGDIRIDEVPEPAVRDDHHVLVAVDLATICASDLAEWRDGPHVIPLSPHRLTGRSAPMTLGHEYVGRVVATGAAVTSVTVGQRVCGDACLRCGACYWCLRGEYNICARGGSVGLHTDGAFAPLMVVPDYTVVSVPDDVSDLHAAIVEPLAVAMHALAQVRARPGDSVAVVGAGMIGASVAALAIAIGAGRVIVVERSAHRKALATSLGVHNVLDSATENVTRQIRELTGGRGVDVVLDCTGRAETVGPSVELARRGGRIGVCGIPHEPSQLRMDRLVYFEREVVGCLGYRFDHEPVIQLLAHGRVPLEGFFADPVPLAGIVDALERMSSDPEVPLRIPVDVNKV